MFSYHSNALEVRITKSDSVTRQCRMSCLLALLSERGQFKPSTAPHILRNSDHRTTASISQHHNTVVVVVAAAAIHGCNADIQRVISK
ncbi:hypothetical protein ElyMa_000620900 [Elysia marginata]|uniref:Uncharacterized protein n=1 Tax=Elysia marginata TaxID=1093978 RepID=A0AAV4G8S5_9GAST|nr:hypothetical protein ElyMa_000620900 [Elysia marginata]